MARQTIVTFTDDIDGSEKDVRTVQFGIDGQTFEIDLSDGNRAKLMAALEPFIKAGTKVTNNVRPIGSAKSARVNSSKPTPEYLKAVRTWVRDNGYKVSDYGRVPDYMLAAYRNNKNVDELAQAAAKAGAVIPPVVNLVEQAAAKKAVPAQKKPPAAKKAAPKKTAEAASNG